MRNQTESGFVKQDFTGSYKLSSSESDMHDA